MSTKKTQQQHKAKAMPKPYNFDWKSALQRVESQEKEHSYKSVLLTKENLVEIKPKIDKVHSLIKSGTEHDKEIAKYLFKISEELNRFANQRFKEKKEISKNSRAALKELAEQDFRLKGSRAFEYVRLASNAKVIELTLPISHLIELSRLKEADLGQLLNAKSVKELNALNYRQIQILVKDFNSAKRKSKPKVVAEKPITFEFKRFIGEVEKIQNQVTEKDLDESNVAKLEAFAEWAMKTVSSYKQKLKKVA
jgi:hypothetical protein